ncbi:glycine-rich domain-containing protein [Pseudomonas reidholzensis]
MGNDPNFAATVTNALALKAPLASPVFTGDPRVPTALATDNDTSAASTAFVRAAMALFGIGGSSPVVAGSLDSIEFGGLYSVGTTTSGGLPAVTPAISQGAQVLHMSYTDGASRSEVQLLIDRLYDRLFYRRCDSGQWKTWVPIWSGADTPKQTGPLDVTPGAMLTVGAWGWGASAVNFTDDIDAISVSALYMVSAATTGTKPEYPALVGVGQIPNGTLEHIERGSSKMATQRWDSLIGSINPLSFVRTKNTAGAWSAWELVVTDRHLPYRAKVYYRSAGVYQWTVPAGVYKVDVEVRGAGGSGGFGSQETGSGGGGGGGISKRLCTVVPGSVITITVGAGGAAVSTVGASGNSGTASAFGTFCSATGGSGGSSGSGATGGFGAGGDINMSLGAGNPALRNAPSTYALGGAGGGGESIFATSNSTTPSQPGMGGGGRTSNQSQPGADGCVFITY